MDNAHPRNSGRTQRCVEASKTEYLLHLTSSPDLAPRNYFLFGPINGKLSDHICESWENLLNTITGIFTGVDQKVLLNVFESWMNRPRWVIKHEWKYDTKQRRNEKHFFEIGKENRRMRTHGPLSL
jgi:hypothetical protein